MLIIRPFGLVSRGGGYTRANIFVIPTAHTLSHRLFAFPLALRLAVTLVCSGLLVVWEAGRRLPVQPTSANTAPLASAAPSQPELAVVAQGRIPMPSDTPAAHASALLPMPPTHQAVLLAFWFAGSRESGADVQIAASQFDRASQRWTPARFVVNRKVGQRLLGFGLRRIGNPVAWRDARGRIHLFVVATGLGGWAASRILHLQQVDDGTDFSALAFRPVGVLPLSWLWNTSHLVRTAPLPLADGGMVLPVYFELGIKYPLALRFDAQGHFAGMVRISRDTHLLQPALLARTPQDWLALMRDSSEARRIQVALTTDGGRHWQDLPDLPLANPDAAIATLTLGPGLHVLAHNTRPDSRAELGLSFSADGLHWTAPHMLAQGVSGGEHSYPALAWADGNLWVSYTDQRHAIAWQRLALVPIGTPQGDRQ